MKDFQGVFKAGTATEAVERVSEAPERVSEID